MYGLFLEISAVLKDSKNAEKSAEVEVAVLAQNSAKDWIIRNVNQECLFRYPLLTSDNGQNVNAID